MRFPASPTAAPGTHGSRARPKTASPGGGELTKDEAVGTPTPVLPADTKEGKAMAKDPVCGMQVDEKKSAASSVYHGTTYYFCAPACKVAFEKSPEKFIAKSGTHVGH